MALVGIELVTVVSEPDARTIFFFFYFNGKFKDNKNTMKYKLNSRFCGSGPIMGKTSLYIDLSGIVDLS